MDLGAHCNYCRLPGRELSKDRFGGSVFVEIRTSSGVQTMVVKYGLTVSTVSTEKGLLKRLMEPGRHPQGYHEDHFGINRKFMELT